jgi:hypothetical protein
MAFAPQIDPGDAPSNYRQPFKRSASTRLTIAVALHLFLSAFPSTSAQVGRYMESGLGECHKGLANVQLPSWSHADYAAYARMKKGL